MTPPAVRRGGGGYSQALKDAIDRAAAANILFIAAAGNGGSDGALLGWVGVAQHRLCMPWLCTSASGRAGHHLCAIATCPALPSPLCLQALETTSM